MKTKSQRRDAKKNEDIFYRMLKGGKMRSRRDWGGTKDFHFTRTEIIELFKKQQGRCYWTGVELVVDSTLRKHPLQPSLDRIDSDKPYSKDNVVIAAFFINVGRGAASKEVFLDSLSKIKTALLRDRTEEKYF